jgi:hypothetical protein
MTRNDTIASLAVNAWINGGRVVWPEANLTECDLRGAKVTFGGRTFTLTEETER